MEEQAVQTPAQEISTQKVVILQNIKLTSLRKVSKPSFLNNAQLQEAVKILPKNSIRTVSKGCGQQVKIVALEEDTNSNRVDSGQPLEDAEVKRPIKVKKPKKVQIFTEHTGPLWHKVHSNFVTKPIISTNLPKAFKHFPIFGKPRNYSELPQFQKKALQEFVGLPHSNCRDYCSPKLLLSGQELKMDTPRPVQGVLSASMALRKKEQGPVEIPAQPKLLTLKKLQSRLTGDSKDHLKGDRKLKYRAVRLLPLKKANKVAETEHLPPDLDPGLDVLFRVRVYRPFTSALGPRYGHNNIETEEASEAPGVKCKSLPISKHYYAGHIYKEPTRLCFAPVNLRQKDVKPRVPVRGRHSVFNCDIVMLGRQLLSELRDRIVCRNDMDLRMDISANPKHPPPQSSRETFPSNFLFINNVFYVDSRGHCRDLSAGVRRFAAGRGLGDFLVRDMGRVTVGELRPRLAYPEVYCHQGNCEHIFQFSEIRLLGPSDPLHRACYPTTSAVSQHQTLYCNTCAEFAAKWIVTHSQRIPFDPAFFCDTCYYSYMYVGNRKVENFRAYPYKGNELNLIRPMVTDRRAGDAGGEGGAGGAGKHSSRS